MSVSMNIALRDLMGGIISGSIGGLRAAHNNECMARGQEF